MPVKTRNFWSFPLSSGRFSRSSQCCLKQASNERGFCSDIVTPLRSRHRNCGPEADAHLFSCRRHRKQCQQLVPQGARFSIGWSCFGLRQWGAIVPKSACSLYWGLTRNEVNPNYDLIAAAPPGPANNEMEAQVRSGPSTYWLAEDCGSGTTHTRVHASLVDSSSGSKWVE